MSPEHDNVDAITGATRWEGVGEVGEGRGEAELGEPCGDAKPAGEPAGEDAPARTRSIQEVVDAVTGATWSTRNRIMEDLFREDLNAGASNLPTFAPPGTPVR